jgi:cell division septation protein DedD
VRGRLGTLRLLLAGALGVGAALLVACGSGGANLIPVANAGPLQNDFNAIAYAVANGNCAAATSALQRAHSDAAALPSTVDPRVKNRINEGLADLDSTAPSECAKNSTSTQTTSAPPTATQTTSTQTTTTAPPPTTSTTTPTTTTTPPTTTTTPPTTTTSPVPDNGGGTPGPAGGGAGAGAGGAGSGGNG